MPSAAANRLTSVLRSACAAATSAGVRDFCNASSKSSSARSPADPRAGGLAKIATNGATSPSR
jgi:hypothetical protein